MLTALTRAAEARHAWTQGHAARVTRLAVALARELAWDDEEVETVRVGALLHDVGKLAIDASVLGKPGPLTSVELAHVRTHPIAGARLVANDLEARCALTSVLYHHERWDGAGYPLRVAGTDIPAEARLVAIADAFDAMTSRRPYRAPLPLHAALAEITNCAGTQFDPLLACAAVDVWSATAAPRAS